MDQLPKQIGGLFASIRALKERSHAGVAIVGAALVEEEVLRALITKMRALSRTMHKRLFDGYGPLSSFSGKIDVAYALGIVTKETYEDLTIIRRVRNQFAHSRVLVDFSSIEIRALFKQFHGFGDGTKDCLAFYLNKLKEVVTHFECVMGSSTSTLDEGGKKE